MCVVYCSWFVCRCFCVECGRDMLLCVDLCVVAAVAYWLLCVVAWYVLFDVFGVCVVCCVLMSFVGCCVGVLFVPFIVVRCCLL